jgi:hypothetical protein
MAPSGTGTVPSTSPTVSGPPTAPADTTDVNVPVPAASRVTPSSALVGFCAAGHRMVTPGSPTVLVHANGAPAPALAGSGAQPCGRSARPVLAARVLVPLAVERHREADLSSPVE